MLQSVRFDKLPQTVEEFFTQRDQIARTPHGGAAMMIVALLLYAQDEALGRQCLTVAVDRERLVEGTNGYRGWQLQRGDVQLIERQVAKQGYLPRTYVKGSRPENGYEIGEGPYEVEFAPNPHGGDLGDGRHKLFVRCSGASSPRPVTLQENEHGVWKASEWSSLVVGVAGIEEPADEL
jgi:hypothetical protein